MMKNLVQLIILLTAIGCTDPAVPRGATMRRSGEKAMIQCNATSQTWHIVCQGSQWYGKVDNCTSGELPVIGEMKTQGTGFNSQLLQLSLPWKIV